MSRLGLLILIVGLFVPLSAFRAALRGRISLAPLKLWHGGQGSAASETARQEAIELLFSTKKQLSRTLATAVLAGGLLLGSPGFAHAARPGRASDPSPMATTVVSPSRRRESKQNSKAPGKSSAKVVVVEEEEVAAAAEEAELRASVRDRRRRKSTKPKKTSESSVITEKAAPAVDTDSEKSNKLTQMGLALVAINLVAFLFSGEDDVSSARGRKRPKTADSARRPPPPASSAPLISKAAVAAVSATSMPSLKASANKNKEQQKLKQPTPDDEQGKAEKVEEDDDLFDGAQTRADNNNKKPSEFSPKAATPPRSAAARAAAKRASVLPSTDDLFDDEDAEAVADQGQAADSVSVGASAGRRPPSKFAAPASSATTPTPPPPPTTPPPPPPPPPAPPAKKNLLDRLFQKPGGGRPTDLAKALAASDTGAQEFRGMVANALAAYVPGDLFPSLAVASEALRDGGETAQAEALRAAKDDSGLGEQDAAAAFAEVANAMLVIMVDNAVSTLGSASTSDDGKPSPTVSALEEVADFIAGAGSVYLQTVPGAVIDPVVYNGRAKKGDLETLYLAYLRDTMSLDSILGAAAGEGAGSEGEGEAVDSGDGGNGKPSVEDKAERLGKLQVVFSIKEGKRSSLEQKAMREMFMGMAKGEGGGGMGDLGGMFEALQGKAGPGGAPDMKALEEMMAGAGMPGGAGGGGGYPGMPDLDKMDPAEAQAMSAEALKSVSGH